MALFTRQKEKLQTVTENPAPVEREIQRLTEANLQEIFNLQFVSTEFSHNNLRVDTLCFDQENKAFVIIEYKKDRSISVIDQGFSYLALMLNNKAEFLIEYNETANRPLLRADINWTQSKVIFVAPYFTLHQKAAINFKNLPIELWEIKFYDNHLVEYKQIEPLESSEKIETVTGSKVIKEVSKVIRTYDLEMHLSKGSEKTRSMFRNFQERISDLGEIIEKYKKFYVGYSIPTQKINFVSIHFFREKLELYILIEAEKLNDPRNVSIAVPESYGWAKNLRRFAIRDEKEIPYAMELVRQSYEFNRDR